MATSACNPKRAEARANFIARISAAALFLCVAPYTACAQSLDSAMNAVVSVLPEWPADARRLEEPEGSGVVVEDGKTVLTALHVVEKALSIRVRTFEGEILTARITGRDRPTDLAILDISKALPVMAGSQNSLSLGERVCAIGNSFGLGLSVTCGVVSGLNRAGIGFNRVEDFVQTDAAVNPGASGGALVNEKGEFAGLLSAIFTKKSDANIGINFAVSAKLASAIAHELKANGRVRRPISGLRLEAVPSKGGTGLMGARVVSTKAGLPGDKAGLKEGDVILRAAGRRVRKPADFVSAMSALLITDAIEIEILRGDEKRKLELKK